jgi:hypothetical protein
MTNIAPSRVTFLDGHSAGPGLLGVLAFPEDYASDVEFTMFLTTRNDQWLQLQFDFDVISLVGLSVPERNYHAWWMAGKRGEIVEVVGGVPTVTNISTAGTGGSTKLGYLAQMRKVGDALFVCGYRRQVYRLDGEQWTLISTAILDNRPKGPWNGFESIDGFSSSDIYTVGDEGEIWHFDGNKWTQCESPTNRNLAEVRCFDGKVWICGDGGLILVGDSHGWVVLWDQDEPSESWWSIERFGGRTFLAGNDFLGEFANGRIQPAVGAPSDITTMRLHQSNGLLWSIGEEDIFSFDGLAWRRIICPQNA